MLTGKQKRYLRKEAHHMDPIFQLGKLGLTDNFLTQIDEALESRELFKITLLQNTDEDIKEVASELSSKLHCEIVQIIGRIIVVYRKSTKEKHQRYSRELVKIRKQ